MQADERRAWQGVDDLSEYLRRVVGTRCRDENEVDDVVQEACVRAARYRAGLGDERMLRPWAARIALNVLAARGARAGRARILEQEEEDAIPAREADEPAEWIRTGPWVLDREAALALLGPAIAELAEEDRRLIRAFYGGGESCRHAAEVCEVPASLAKVKVFRARRRLMRIVRRRAALAARSWVGPDGIERELSAAVEVAEALAREAS